MKKKIQQNISEICLAWTNDVVLHTGIMSMSSITRWSVWGSCAHRNLLVEKKVNIESWYPPASEGALIGNNIYVVQLGLFFRDTFGSWLNGRTKHRKGFSSFLGRDVEVTRDFISVKEISAIIFHVTKQNNQDIKTRNKKTTKTITRKHEETKNIKKSQNE